MAQRRPTPAARKAPPQDTKVYDVPVDATDTIKGNKTKITIAEFSEFQCPFASSQSDAPADQKEYGDKVRIVFAHNLPSHKDAPLAAAAAPLASRASSGNARPSLQESACTQA